METLVPLSLERGNSLVAHCQKTRASMLNIIVSCFHRRDGFNFSKAVVVALREYADAVERNFDGNGYDRKPSDNSSCV